MADFNKKLVDQAALEALAKGLNNKSKAAVEAEKARAQEAEQAAKTVADAAKSTADSAAADLVNVKKI